MRRVILATALCVAACQSSSGPPGAVEQRVAAAQGPQVDGICFDDGFDGATPLSRDLLLVSNGLNDWYQLSLEGMCDADWAEDKISEMVEDRGSLCVAAGDDIEPYRLQFAFPCSVVDIHEWREEADPEFVRNKAPEFVPGD